MFKSFIYIYIVFKSFYSFLRDLPCLFSISALIMLRIIWRICGKILDCVISREFHNIGIELAYTKRSNENSHFKIDEFRKDKLPQRLKMY